MLTVVDVVIFGMGIVCLLAWLAFFIVGLRHAQVFDSLEEKEFPFKEIYFVGYEVMEVLHYRYKSKKDRKLRKEISVLYGEKYTEYYLRVIYAQKVTISLTLLVLSFVMYGLANDIMAMVVILVFAGLAYYYFGTVAEKKIEKRSEEMMSDFSNVVSKLALLTNAGMIMKEAWEEVAYTGDTVLYKEMQLTVTEMKNGVSEIDALFHFGIRCILPEIKKFTSTIIQGIIKGNSELTYMLQEQSKEVWAAKKQNVKRQGEKAASKLMIPIMMMFVGILIMILIPIFTNLGV